MKRFLVGFASLFFFGFFLNAHQVLASEIDFRSTVKIKSYKKTLTNQVIGQGSGSGTLISAEGHLLTNHHVIYNDENQRPFDAFEVCITLVDGQLPDCRFTARLIVSDEKLDLALLKLNESDIFDKKIPNLPYLNHRLRGNVSTSSEVTVVGYPGSGGETITVTKGQISGSDQLNEYRYFKTDTDFDHGSSGGTALDEKGRFIGVPTYIRSYAENVGYFLDLTEATSWIDTHLSKIPIKNQRAEEALKKELSILQLANKRGRHTQVEYPYTQLVIPKNWQFLEVNSNSYYVAQKEVSNPVSLSVRMLSHGFEIDSKYLSRLEKELSSLKESFPDYEKKEVVFAGQSAWRISYTSLASQNITYYIPYGYQLVVISYSIDLNNRQVQEKEVDQVLRAFEFTKVPSSTPAIKELVQFEDPSFSIRPSGEWRLMLNPEKRFEELLIEGVAKDNFDGKFRVYYQKIPHDERGLSTELILKNILGGLYNERVISKGSDVALGGLKGLFYVYEYEGKDYQKVRKNLTFRLIHGDYYFLVEYDDLSKSFDGNLSTIESILNSLKFSGQWANPDLKNSYGNLNYLFSDIQYHPFSLAITSLADEGLVQSKVKDQFSPESPISRLEALKWVVDSYLSSESLDLKEVNYISYAKKKGVIHLFPFEENRPITLAESLKILLKTYDIPLWKGLTNPWHKKYLQKGFELQIIPYGLYDPDQPITRAELAQMIYKLYNAVK